MKKIGTTLVAVALSTATLFGADVYLSDNALVPNLTMKNTKLGFSDIQGYQNYKIVATHFRKDKNEIRYILANPVAYNALREGKKIMPNGSKVVKIGWSVKDMPTFTSALEADKIQRVEYMIKDATKHKESDGWGYARFVKKNGKYQAWGGDPKSCVACHASVKSQDALFTKFQRLF
jgi:hypothetical protein